MSPAKAAKLEDQAATAALYVTRGKNEKTTKPSTRSPLDADGKLSSASAATSLKHAQPQDLPAFPIVGVQNTESSAGAAASLANANQKSFEYWKPGEIQDANKAALTAKDYKSEPLWQPDLGPAGSKAAQQAHKEGGEVQVWRPSDTDAGHSAAGQAMRKKGLSPQVQRGPTADGEKKALMAAVGAVSGNRKRSGSTPNPPPSYPDAQNSTANALKAAAASTSRPSKPPVTNTTPSQPPINAAKLHNQAVTNLSREMYTSLPPVAPEREEKNKQDTLHAAAVSMAKKMYDLQQKQAQEAAALRQSESQYAASVAGDRPQSSASSNGSVDAPKYVNLEEAAKKLAAERLAKLHDEHAAYRTYYGTEKTPSKRLSMRGRRRASSDGDAAGSDEERSRRIRNQMSLFNDKLTKVDSKQRQQDRNSLLAAAQRNVRASMTAQDERVFNETGKISPAMMAEWEAKAKAKAEADSKVRMVNHGMVSIGGGKFLDQSEVDAIASAKVQPTLDDIAETADKHRARDEELRQLQLEREKLTAEKVADDKERSAKTKEEWKRFRDDEKKEERARKEEAKSKKTEQKKSRDEDKQEKRKTALGKIKGIFSRDEADGGNKEALARLEGKGTDPAEEPPKPTKEEEADTKETSEKSSIAEETGPEDAVAAGAATGAAAMAVEEEAEKHDKGDDSKPKESIETTSVSEKEPPSVEKKSSAPTESVSSSKGKAAPLADRIAPPPVAVQPTTETTVTGPTSATKEKDGSKVSSWLKSKLGRRSSKAAPPASSPDRKPTISAPKDPKVFVGGANLGAPDTSTKNSSDVAPDSMREVALAGTQAGPVDAPVVSPATEPDEDEARHPAAMASGGLSGEEHPHAAENDEGDDDSTSISSLSSDEDTRGRSQMRLADQIQQSGPIFGSTAATHDRPAAAVSKEAPGAAVAKPDDRETSEATGADEEKYEEARDKLDASPEAKAVPAATAAPDDDLAPPNKAVLGSSAGEGRKSDSPARDSKFVENL